MPKAQISCHMTMNPHGQKPERHLFAAATRHPHDHSGQQPGRRTFVSIRRFWFPLYCRVPQRCNALFAFFAVAVSLRGSCSKITSTLAAIACLAAFHITPAAADDKPSGPAAAAMVPPKTTTGTLTINGTVTAYKAAAGFLPIVDNIGPDRYGKAKANLFSIAYIKTMPDGTPLSDDERSKRPVTFAFNGGPGSSSVWLHMGALGPVRIKFGAEGERPVPPFELVENIHSWLPFTDLVFIDPVSTGFSRASDGEDAHQFHGLEEDARAVGEFIRLWLVRHYRWLSPKYLAGESYGTTRACQLAAELQGHHGVDLTGITLISPVLNFATVSFDVGNDLPYPLFLPSYTAIAFYHKQLKAPLDADLAKTLKEVEDFAMGEYTLALAKGDTLGKTEREALAAKLSAYTGLSAGFILANDLRVPIFAFTKELLKSSSRTIGRLDARYIGIDRVNAGISPDFDPSYAVIQGPFTAAFNSYIRQTLQFEADAPYEILTGNVHPWNYPGRNRYATVADTLRSVMSQNPNLKVLALSGYTDLATPYFAVDYTVSHLSLDPSLRPNISQRYYNAGHMMYLREADLAQSTKDVAAWYATAVPPATMGSPK